MCDEEWIPPVEIRLCPLTGAGERTEPVSKETYYRGKRDLLYADF